MNFLEYNKDEKLCFNYKKSCGLWLIVVALIIFAATVIGAAFLSINTNKKVLNKFSDGPSSKFQNKMSLYAVIFLFILMFLLGGPFFATENWRLIWLGALMATALHFFLYYFVHGKSMIYLAILCAINVGIGYIFPDIPLTITAYIDAAIKLGFGIYLFFFSKPTQQK